MQRVCSKFIMDGGSGGGLTMFSILWQSSLFPALPLFCFYALLVFSAWICVRCVSYYILSVLCMHTNTLCAHSFDDKSYILSFYFVTYTQTLICILRMVFLHGRKFIKIIILWAWHIFIDGNSTRTNERAWFLSAYPI